MTEENPQTTAKEPTAPVTTPATTTPAPAPTETPKPAEAAAQKDPATPPALTDAAQAPFTIDKLELPEGFTIPEEVGSRLVETVTKHNLPSEAVNEFVKLHTELVGQAQQAGEKLWADTQVEWQSAAKADEEIGGKGDPAKLKDTLQTIGTVLDDERYGGPKLKEALKITGAGNHPEVIRALYRMAKALTEGSFVSGQPPPADQTKRSYAERIYSTPKK